jgi:ubiquinone/menaquinone biosynthesis C-methylase UbiE
VATDPSFLLERQYRTADNLQARIVLHERFSTTPEPFPRWVFDRLPLGSASDVLEVGCGSGNLWYANRDRIPPGLRLTLTDFSKGMVEEARGRLGDLATYRVADVQELPFADESFDLVIANHMLFHVPDRKRALSEIARVLRSGGVVVSTTNGRDHLRELGTAWGPRWSRKFGLENGPAHLSRHFEEVELELFHDSLEVTEVEPLLDFVRSLVFPPSEEDLARLAADAEASIAREGSFHVTKSVGLMHGRQTLTQLW